MENGVLDIEKISPTLYLGGELYINIAESCVRNLNRGFCVYCFKA